MRDQLSWESTALRLAYNIAYYRSPDPNTQVGSCIIKHNNEILLGYNGAPPGIEIDWSDRIEKRKRVIHAETNVLTRIQYGEAKIFAVTHFPCNNCLLMIAQKGIKKVYYGEVLENYNPKEVQQIGEEFGISFIKLNI